MPLELFAVAAPGLEGVVADELRALDAQGEQQQGGVAWRGDLASLYRALLHLRTASRVLVRVASFSARGFPELERHARRIEWQRYMTPGTPVLLRVSSAKSRLYHERAIAERLLAVIGPDARSRHTRADEDGELAGAQTFVVRIVRDRCTISADAAGALLYLRGYRQQIAKAPLRETIAAAILHTVTPSVDLPLLDPLCGSGTVPIEAALRARRIPVGLARADREPRDFRCLHWPEHDAAAWRDAVQEARAAILPHAPAPIFGSDRDAGGIDAARANAARAGVANDVVFEQHALTAAPVPAGVGALVTNPPYGLRVGERARLRDLYAALGTFARRRLAGWTFAMLCADRSLCNHAGLPLQSVLTTRNGGIAVELLAGRVPKP